MDTSVMPKFSGGILISLWILIIFSTFPEVTSRSFTIDYGNNTFLKDGQPFRYISGSIHYSRVPKFYWKDRLQKMFAAGLNAIQVYIPWNIHHTDVNVFDFEGQQDVIGFIKLAQQIGLLVILRPGPYICAEWDFGGLPAWILKNKPNVVFRTMDMDFITYVDIWFMKLLPMLRHLLYVNGGPIIAVQVENEYGSYFAHDQLYTKYLRDLITLELVDDVVLFTTDGSGDGYLKYGTIPKVYATVDFGVTQNPAKSFKPQRDYEPKGPLVNSEFYTGWLDHWGQRHSVVDKKKVATSLDLILKYGANVNMYMFEGGTNFGYWNGANYPDFQPVPTSYDYDAPLTEAGDITDKYMIIREVIGKYRPVTNMSIPGNTSKANYGKVQMKFVSTVQDILDQLCPGGPTTSKYPLTMEAVGQNQGFALYRHHLKKSVTKATLKISGIRDRGYVMVDKVPVGLVDRTGSTVVYITGHQGQQLDIFVENQGHINYGSGINNNSKGLIQNVTLGGEVLQDWVIYPVLPDHFKPTDKIIQSSAPKQANGLMTPSIYIGIFEINSAPADTFLDMSGWTKGQAILAGQQNLGRYWPKTGPQVRLFVPAPYLKTSRNTLIMLELESAPCRKSESCFISLVDTPLINSPVPSIQSDTFNWHKYH